MCRYFLNLHPCLHFLFFYVHFSGVKVFVDGGRYMCLIGATNCLVVKLKSKFPNHVIMNNWSVHNIGFNYMQMRNGVKGVLNMVWEHNLSKPLNFPILIYCKSWTIFYLGFGIHYPMITRFFSNWILLLSHPTIVDCKLWCFFCRMAFVIAMWLVSCTCCFD